MRNFLSFIIMPLPVLYLLLLAAVIFLILNRKGAGRILLGSAGLWFLIISTLPVPKGLVQTLENKYPQLSETAIKNLPDSCDIIVLGGGHSDDKDLSPNNKLSSQALARLVEGIRIHNMVPGSKLILSGYGGGSKLSQAVVLYQTALILKVDSTSMEIISTPSNTRMEAEEYVKKNGTKNDLIVVTSDIHMPRAIILFHKAGLNPVAAPTNQILRYGSGKYRLKIIPSADNIVMMEEVIHEYAGILWMWLGGK
jgi:uncharacterized SAM-binding protein YcdF (DUF218 family)